MKTKKDFDCVEMKQKIQQSINKEFKDVPDKDKYRIIMERAKHNPFIGELVRAKIIS
jgi:hypothetical protein